MKKIWLLFIDEETFPFSEKPSVDDIRGSYLKAYPETFMSKEELEGEAKLLLDGEESEIEMSLKEIEVEILEKDVREWFEDRCIHCSDAIDITGIDLDDIKDWYDLVDEDSLEAEDIVDRDHVRDLVDAIVSLLDGDKSDMCFRLGINENSPRKIVEDKLFDFLGL